MQSEATDDTQWHSRPRLLNTSGTLRVSTRCIVVHVLFEDIPRCSFSNIVSIERLALIDTYAAKDTSGTRYDRDLSQ